jgi:uncharacterized protein YndB with AHSA1/START domain
MITIEHSVQYPESSQAVFDAVTDFPHLPSWQHDVLEARLVSGPLAEGAVVHQVRKVMGRRTETDLTVTEFLPGERITLQTPDGASPSVRQSYRIRVGGAGTRVDFVLEIDGVPRMAEHLARTQLSRQVPDMFSRLGNLLIRA